VALQALFVIQFVRGAIMATFEERLRELRKKRRINRAELAKTIGVSESTVSMWELGQRFPRKPVLMKLCDYFDVSYDYLMGVSEEAKQGNYEMIYRILNNPNGEEMQELKKKAQVGIDLLNKYGALTEQHQQAVSDMIDFYYDKDK
jgi:transcriptional regulator with XRE-family HTH domain